MSIYVVAVLVCLAIILKDANAGLFSRHTTKSHNDSVEFHLYTKNNPLMPYLLKVGDENNVANSHLNPDNTTIIFIHGFAGSADGASSQLIKNAYMANGEFNVILVHWKKLAHFPNYYWAFKNCPSVGKYLGELIIWLNKKRVISIPEIHIIGFSLGAHIAAFASEHVIQNSLQKVGRITGLDPASPGWDKVAVASNGLSISDANFVDVIHTNSKHYGVRAPMGHADFYVNYGEVQPGCEGNLHELSWKHPSSFINAQAKIGCSHKRACQYFAESISNPFEFPSSKCTQWDPAVEDCTPDPDVFMGFAMSKETRGIFLVETKSEAPYGSIGIPYVKSLRPHGKKDVMKDKKQDNQLNNSQFNEVLPERSNDVLSRNDENDPDHSLVIKPVDAHNIANSVYDNDVALNEGNYVYTHYKPSQV